MSKRWPSILLGFLLAIALAFVAERAYHTYQWAGEVNLEAKASAAYLSQIVGYTADKKPIHRYELIDAALRDYVSNLQALKAPAKQ